MKIMVLEPFATHGEGVAFFGEFVPSDVDLVGLEEGPVPGGGRVGTLYGVPQILESIKDAERQGYDAVVLACHSDPGIQDVRQLVDIPVIGPGMVAMHISAMLGTKTCMLKATNQARSWSQENIMLYGFEGRVIVRAVKASVPEAMRAYNEYKISGKPPCFINYLVDVSIKAIEEEDVDVLTFGCGALIWTPKLLRSELLKKGYDIPVVNPLPVAVEVARSLVKLKLTHSRITYPKNPLYANMKEAA
ncbi:aspartate/glutamate racemase family protein [Chloroflexota bacterium]